MTNTKNPPNPTTGCAPLGRLMVETVSLEVVWAAVYAAHYVACGGGADVHDAAAFAQDVVDELLDAFPRGGT